MLPLCVGGVRVSHADHAQIKLTHSSLLTNNGVIHPLYDAVRLLTTAPDVLTNQRLRV